MNYRSVPVNGKRVLGGDVLIFVHGFNNSMSAVMARHDLLQTRLKKAGFDGVIISFDWPAADSALNYLEDRSDARATAKHLVDGGIRVLSDMQLRQRTDQCEINVHLLGHSTGAYVIREAFVRADHDADIALVNWTVSQVMFIGGDISASSIVNGKSNCLHRHSARITNYSNPFDSVLKLSNAKRVGLAPRVGRVGVPDGAEDKFVDVDCGDHWDSGKKKDPHSWHFDDALVTKDMALTMVGDIDRWRIPTRTVRDGRLVLQKPAA